MNSFEQIISNLNMGSLPEPELDQLKQDLSQIAQSHGMDLENADIEDMRKIVSLYLQKVLLESAKH